MKKISCLLFVALSIPPRPLLAETTAIASGDPVKLDQVEVEAERSDAISLTSLTLPFTAAVTAQQIHETINVIDTEDAVKYLPSVYLRKRNVGDTQAVMATRVWGVSSSARSLVFADGVPLTALIANNNTIGAPRWGLVSPVEIERIDLMYGPFSAAYAGNSMGAVMEITTRLPEKFEATLEQTGAWQSFKLYGTHTTYRTLQSAVTAGDRIGNFSFWISANDQDSFSQPLTFVTSATFPTGTTGGYVQENKLGAPANVLGATGLLHTKMINAKFKAAYDLTPILRGAYTYGYWRNEANASVATYLHDSAGQPTYAGQAGFASGTYQLLEAHSSHSLSLTTDTKGRWDFNAIATLYRFDQDTQRMPVSASTTGTSFGTAGRDAVLGGTGWSTLDLKGTWRSGEKDSATVITFGVHDDRYKLYNPTFNLPDWQGNSPPNGVATEGDGKTRTQAIFIQDLWRITSALKFTAGVRYEQWRAYDGTNVNGSTLVYQPTETSHQFSPKAVLAWTPAPAWLVSASVGRAYRFATASELYQLVSTGATFTAPNPNLKPDNDLSTELKLQRTFGQTQVRVSFFQDNVHDAIIAQFNPLVAGSSQLYSYISNVDHVRANGLEAAIDAQEFFVRGLGLSGSLTYLDAKTLALSGRASATAAADAAIGKRLPNIPDWRANFVATYHFDSHWSLALGGRYSAKMFTTLDNTDVNFNTYQGFAAWFVADAHLAVRLVRHWTVQVGADNLLNRTYFLFHPFPQRTWITNLNYAF